MRKFAPKFSKSFYHVSNLFDEFYASSLILLFKSAFMVCRLCLKVFSVSPTYVWSRLLFPEPKSPGSRKGCRCIILS